MDDARLEELAQSIRANGIIQPIVVRRAGDGYEIVAGERRWRASQRAGLLKVPVVVRDIPDDRLLAAALIENIQREDLNPDRGSAGLPPPDRRFPPHPGADRRLGRQGSLVDRQLPAAAQAAARSARERRRRRAVDGPRPRARRRSPTKRRCCALARDVIAKQLSVRETEALIRKATAAGRARRRSRRKTSTPAPPKIACASPSAPASASSAKARGGPDRDRLQPRKTSCSGIYEQLTRSA